jgi:uncharacterized protein (TIGR00730 family)
LQQTCIFCGSSTGVDEVYAEAARGIGLVYGGGRIALMGEIADSVLDAGGEVIGVMPKVLVERQISHPALTDLHIVGSMHERKALMNDLSDGFLALPGGTGTLEEFFKVLTWAQLGIHEKPCGLLEVAGYWSHLLALFDHMVDRGFLRPEHRALVLAASDPRTLLDRLRDFRPPRAVKWAPEPEG